MKQFFTTLFLLFVGLVPVLAQSSPVPGEVLYLPMDGHMRDYSGFNNNGFIRGRIMPETDKWGRPCAAMRFNGTDAYLTMPPSPSLNSPTSQFSASLWAYIVGSYTADGGQSYYVKFICKAHTTAMTNISYTFDGRHIGSGGNLDLGGLIWGSNNTIAYYPTGVEFRPPQWMHFGITYDGSNVKIYVNGVNIHTAPKTDSITVNNDSLEIGRNPPYGIEYFNGVMDEVRIYKRALTAAEMLTLYNHVPPIDRPVPTISKIPGCSLSASATISNLFQANIYADSARTQLVASNVSNVYTFTGGQVPGNKVYIDNMANSCPQQFSVALNTLPFLVNAGADKAACIGDTVRLDGLLANPLYSYNWTSLEGTILQPNTANPRFALPPGAPAGTRHLAIVTVTNVSNGCQGFDTVAVTVSPKYQGTYYTRFSCVQGVPDTLVATNLVNARFYADSIRTSFRFTVNGTFRQPLDGSHAARYFIVNNPQNCYQQFSIAPATAPRPSVNAGADQFLCEGDTASINITANPAMTYNWLIAGGQLLSNNTASTRVVVPGGVGRATAVVIVTNPVSGCQVTDTVSVTATQKYQGSYATILSCAAGVVDTLMVTDLVNAQIYADSNRTTLLSTQNGTWKLPITNLTAPRYYIVHNAALCRQLFSVVPLFVSKPAVNAGADLFVCAGDTAFINMAAAAGLTYNWQVNAGQLLSNSTAATRVVLPPGAASTATAIVTATNPVSGCQVVDTVMVTATQKYQGSYTTRYACAAGVADTLVVTGLVNAQIYADSNRTNLLSTQNGTWRQLLTSTSAPRYYIVHNATLCRQLFSVAPVIVPRPTVSAGPDLTVCTNDTVILGLPAIPDVAYAWISVDGRIVNGTSANPKFVFSPQPARQSLRVWLSATYLPTGCYYYDTVLVNANPPFVGQTIVASGCSNPDTLTVTNLYNTTVYSDSARTQVIGQNINGTFQQQLAASGRYYFTYNIGSGCERRFSAGLEKSPVAQPELLNVSGTLNGDADNRYLTINYQATAPPAGQVASLVIMDSAGQVLETVSVPSTGTAATRVAEYNYTNGISVKLQQLNACGQLLATPVQQTIIAEKVVWNGTQHRLNFNNYQGKPLVRYEIWQSVNGGVYAQLNQPVTGNTVVVTPAEIRSATCYRMVGYDAAGLMTISNQVCVPQYPELEVFNVFTPNGDGYNDKFVVRNLEYFEPGHLQIVNRWGTMVYESSNYKNDFDGKDLPAAVYFYHLTVGDGRVFKGWLQVLK